MIRRPEAPSLQPRPWWFLRGRWSIPPWFLAGCISTHIQSADLWTSKTRIDEHWRLNWFFNSSSKKIHDIHGFSFKPHISGNPRDGRGSRSVPELEKMEPVRLGGAWTNGSPQIDCYICYIYIYMLYLTMLLVIYGYIYIYNIYIYVICYLCWCHICYIIYGCRFN